MCNRGERVHDADRWHVLQQQLKQRASAHLLLAGASGLPGLRIDPSPNAPHTPHPTTPPPCRRNGKPTSLGCFDHEEQAARAYDKMMLWCELHNAAGVKGGITNFDPSGGCQAGPD